MRGKVEEDEDLRREISSEWECKEGGREGGGVHTHQRVSQRHAKQ